MPRAFRSDRPTGLDRDAFAALYTDPGERVLRDFARHTLDPQTAADLTAETFAAAIESRRRFDPRRGEPAAWLFGIAHHQLSRYLRNRRVEDSARRRLGFADHPLAPADLERVEALIDFTELGHRVQAALQTLAPDQREAVVLRVVSELPYMEIAQRLHCSEQAARLRVFRGLRELGLRLALDEDHYGGMP